MKWILLTAAFAVLGLVGCNKQEASVSGQDGKVLTLAAPKKITIDPGATAQVKLSITRKQFDGPVTIDFAQLPTGITVLEADHTIPKGVNDATFTLKAADNATGQGQAIKVSASAEGMKVGPEEFVLNITEKKVATQEPNRKEVLTLNVPKTVTIHPGETAALKLSVTRKQFDGPVTIDFAQLPTSVTVVEVDHTIPKGANDATFTLKATPNATGEGHAIKVSASGEGMKTPPVEFVLNVTDKKAGSLEQKRKDLDQAVRATLAETNKNIANLEVRAREAQGTVKVDADAALVKLHKSRDDLEKRLEESRTTSEAAWENFATGVHNAALDLQNAAKQAWDKR